MVRLKSCSKNNLRTSFNTGKYRPMKDISIGGVIMLDRSTEVGVDEKEEVSVDVNPLILTYVNNHRSWSQSWSTEEEPVQMTARRNPPLQSRLSIRRTESSFNGICYDMNINYSAVITVLY